MVLLSNGTDVPNCHDKKIQQKFIAAAGMHSVWQASGDKFEYVESFLKTESYPLMVKPTESAGSDGVKLCHSVEEAKEHFHLLMKNRQVVLTIYLY
jgi:biotin carboxylase